MGLFVGASVITAFEVLDLLFHTLGIQVRVSRKIGDTFYAMLSITGFTACDMKHMI